MNTPLDCFTEATADGVPVRVLAPDAVDAWRRDAAPRAAAWAAATGFDGRDATVCLLPGDDGRLSEVLVAADPDADTFALGDLAQRLPAGDYRLAAGLDEPTAARALLGFALGAYRFTRYRSDERGLVRFALPAGDLAYRLYRPATPRRTPAPPPRRRISHAT